MEITYSFGILDLIHAGHIQALFEGKKNSDLHIFGLVKDDAVVEWNGYLISDYEDRVKTLEGIKYIDKVVPQDTFDPTNNLKKIHDEYPDANITLMRGSNWKFFPAEDFLKSINGKVKIIPYYDKFSPEKILEQMREKTKCTNAHKNVITSKASTLLALKNQLKKSYIEDIIVTSEYEFLKNKREVLDKIKNKFSNNKIVVRSSSSMEDGFEKSNAGYFESILNVDSSKDFEVEKAIIDVANSYKKIPNVDTSKEQILIQKQTDNIEFSGVIFTRDIQNNRPYYLINYDDNGSTDSVTSGMAGKSIRISHNASIDVVDGKWKNLLIAIQEIESLLTGAILDIEFAIKKDDTVVIFQVRPLAANYKYKKDIDENKFFQVIDKEKERFLSIKDAFTNLPMIWSDMAFWNPAEIIGTNPKTLDYTLYKEIITSRAWNEGLIHMGYKKVPHNLMRRFANKPFISLEYSFRSLIPDTLSDNLTNKLINSYRNKLKNNLKLHDKIEFEIVLSCLDFETQDRLNDLKQEAFTENEINEIKEALHKITQKALYEFFINLTEDKKNLLILDITRQKVEAELKNSNLNVYQLINYFNILIDSLKINGTPQFARQARYAFIAKSLCRTLVSKGFISFDDMENFMLTINTVASDFTKDLDKYLMGKMQNQEFMLKYGHLRSGTYDITTDTYSKINFVKNKTENSSIKLQDKLSDSIINDDVFNDALSTLNLECNNFKEFLKTAFEQREYFKFEFTKTLSLAIEVVARIGEKFSFSRYDMCHLAVADIKASTYYSNGFDLNDFWTTVINQRKLQWEFNTQIELPEVILNENSFNFIKIEQMRPNFITDKVVTEEIVNLEENKNADIEGKIVLIDKADPGYDWIFTKNIKGLITKYGGVASHMAIRCSEFGLPAAIGCGEKIYSETKLANKITLDCKNAKIINEESYKCLG